MWITRVLALLLTAWVATAPPTAQTPAVDARNTEAWFEAIAAHTPGQHDAAVDRLSTWTRTDVNRALSALARIDPDNRARLVSRALVLHTDVALFNRTTTGYTLPGTGAEILLYADGELTGTMSGTFHWDVGRQLIERLPRGDDRLRIARTYYRSTGAVLQLWGEHSELERHLAAATRIIGADAVLLMYEGTLHQVYADARSQRFFDQRRQALRDRSPLSVTGSGRLVRAPVSAQDLPPTAERSRANAERFFRRALAVDASLDEARVRLAHVLHDRGRHADAARELEQLTHATPPSTFLAYYTAVLTGRVARALDRLDDAQAAFEQAVILLPHAQGPRVALSELAMARGQREAALRYLAPLSADTGIDDLWWRLGRTHGATARELVEQMWAALR